MKHWIPQRNKINTTLCTAFLLMAVPLGAWAQQFVHPGGLHTQADFDRMKAKVAAGEHPWIDDWNVLIKDRKAQSDYKAAPNQHMASRQRAQDDANAAYLNALRWIIAGSKDNAECAVRILNGWADTVSEVPYGHDQPGLSGIPIGTFAIAAEVLRTYPGWPADDQNKFKHMLLKYFYPICHDFLDRHNGRPDSAYWANWDTCNMRAIMAIGVFCDDRAKFAEAVEYYKHGRGMGSISNAVPYLYPGGIGQWQESGRDQAHVMGGQGLLAEMCQIAWNQGVDLFGYDNNRLLTGAEYTAQYNLWKGVPYTFYNNADQARQCYISQNYHGRLDASHFELIYNHYVVLKGLKAPFVQHFADLRRPEPGEIDVLGYGTLVYTLDAAKSPVPSAPPPVPRDVVAIPGLKRVELKWSPSGAYSAHGYEVSRSTSPEGPFTVIHSTTRWTTPAYTDTDVKPGNTYYYKVAALSNAGKSTPSTIVKAMPDNGGMLPNKWRGSDIGHADTKGRDKYSPEANHSFRIAAGGREIGGKKDDCHFVYTTVEGDCTLTARLIERKGRIYKTGLMMRSGKHPDTPTVALSLGEIGGRQCRFFTRSKEGENMRTHRGDDYTWIPVWLRIQRQGSTFIGSQSSDGITWFPISTNTVNMSDNYLVGLAVAEGGKSSKDKEAYAKFDNVALERMVPKVPLAPTNLIAKIENENDIRLTWNNPSHKKTGIKIEASIDGAPFYEIADLAADATSFVNTGLSNPTVYSYRIRAYNHGGYSTYSNTASIRH